MRNGYWLLVAILACVLLPGFECAAQNYPVKPVRILVGFLPGGGADVVARMVAQKLTEDLGQPVVVENRPGASGTIAAEAIARAPANGYALLVISTAEPAQGALRTKLSYDLARDLAPAGTSKEIIARLNTAIAKAVNTPEMKKAFMKQGLDPQAITPDEFAAFLRKEIARSAMLIKLTGAQAE